MYEKGYTKYSPFDKNITALLSGQDIWFLEENIFSVPDNHSQLIAKRNITGYL